MARTAGRDQLVRVEGLLAAVQVLVTDLQRTSIELEQEVAGAFYQDDGGAGSALATLELENDRLKHALEGRALIEQAKGMLMAGRGCTADEAFALLTTLARRDDRSVRDVAASMVRPTGSSAEPVHPLTLGAIPELPPVKDFHSVRTPRLTLDTVPADEHRDLDPTASGEANDVPPNPVPTNPVSTNPVPTNPAPTNPAPTNPAAVERGPAEPAEVDLTSLDRVLVQESEPAERRRRLLSSPNHAARRPASPRFRSGPL